MAPTNIMVAGSTPGQGVGEWVGNLLWWGGVLVGITALCVALVWATHEGRVARPLNGHRRVPRREPRNPWMEKIRQMMACVGAWRNKVKGQREGEPVPTPTEEAAPRRTEQLHPGRDARTRPGLMKTQHPGRGTNAEPDPGGSPCFYPPGRVEPEAPAPILTNSLMSSGWATPIGRCSPCLWMDWNPLRLKENHRLPPTRLLMSGSGAD
ncbi:hypothetical protein DFH08DRAFT_820049 [Mycena albidolilacea]|uniref:Uncharacterized protein n=1 Tax=Mycena albidolilacea TaxID=1033008 RepID=A0AAD6ZDN9_9AGAR|nr:hypothetical protein DFH08DRAFT_820049 [Mycena albidolilacea]